MVSCGWQTLALDFLLFRDHSTQHDMLSYMILTRHVAHKALIPEIFV